MTDEVLVILIVFFSRLVVYTEKRLSNIDESRLAFLG